MNKKIIILASIFFIVAIISNSFNVDVSAVSYYNWIRNSSFEGNINLIEDASFESGLYEQGLIYGNWSDYGASFSLDEPHTGVYSLRTYYSGGGKLSIYNFTESVLGSDIEEFSFWYYHINGDYQVKFYYSDLTDSGYITDSTTSSTWINVDLTSEINDAKYVTAFLIRTGDVYSGRYDDFICSISDVDGQTEVSITSSPWGIYDFGELFSSFFDFDWSLGSDITTDEFYTGSHSFEFIEGSSMPIFQSIGFLDSDLVHFADMYIKTDNVAGVKVAVGITYSDGRGTGKNVSVAYNGGAWQHHLFSNFIYDDAYITGITIYVFDESDSGDSTFIDDVGLWASVPTDWLRFDWTMSPIPISQMKKAFSAYQRTTYTLTFNLYDENGSKTETGNYQIVDGGFGLSTGSFTSGVFSKTLNKRTSSTVRTMTDVINVLIILDDETIQIDIDGTWLYVAIPDDTETVNTTNFINWLSMFLVIFLPALLFAGGIYENNQQPDSMHISPLFGLIAGLCLSIGIGVYTSIVPLWLLIVMIVAIVVLMVGMINNR